MNRFSCNSVLVVCCLSSTVSSPGPGNSEATYNPGLWTAGTQELEGEAEGVAAVGPGQPGVGLGLLQLQLHQQHVQHPAHNLHHTQL